MPTPPDHRFLDQDLLTGTSYGEDSQRRRSPGRRRQGKLQKKYENPSETLGDHDAEGSKTQAMSVYI